MRWVNLSYAEVKAIEPTHCNYKNYKPWFTSKVCIDVNDIDLKIIMTMKIMVMIIKYIALLVSVPFLQFKKREKHPWKCVTFSKVASCSLQLY